jgi:hypothetical protein
MDEMMWKFLTFVIATGVLVYISRASLRQPHSHGFYRFFAWECILVLFLLNVESWFIDPFSWHQLTAWTLLFACLVPLAFGVRSLRGHGKPAEERPGDPSLLAFEKTTALVTTGIKPTSATRSTVHCCCSLGASSSKRLTCRADYWHWSPPPS